MSHFDDGGCGPVHLAPMPWASARRGGGANSRSSDVIGSLRARPGIQHAAESALAPALDRVYAMQEKIRDLHPVSEQISPIAVVREGAFNEVHRPCSLCQGNRFMTETEGWLLAGGTAALS